MAEPAGMRQRGPAGKARYREIKAAPKKMLRTAITAEMRTKFLENPVGLQEHAPESTGVFRIVSRVFFIAIERDRFQRFVRQHSDLHFNCELSQFTHHLAVKTRDAFWL